MSRADRASSEALRFGELVAIDRGEDDDWFDPVLTEDTPLYVHRFPVFSGRLPGAR